MHQSNVIYPFKLNSLLNSSSGNLSALQKQENFEVAGEADSGKSAISLISKLCPDIVIMDINMPGMNGIQTTKKVLEINSAIKVIALSMHSEKVYVAGMLNVGACAYLNGQVAMDLFARNEYDFVNLDYVLPGGINGMDVYHHIRKTNQIVPVLFISGNIEFLESIKELKQKDAYIDYLSKPCRNKDYVNGINELLEKTLAEQ